MDIILAAFFCLYIVPCVLVVVVQLNSERNREKPGAVGDGPGALANCPCRGKGDA